MSSYSRSSYVPQKDLNVKYYYFYVYYIHSDAIPK
jgi:hypothetical protein